VTATCNLKVRIHLALMNWIRSALRRYKARRYPWREAWFDALLHRVPALQALKPDQRAQLRELTREFLVDKSFHAADGYELDESMRVKIAALASWPALHLGYAALAGWYDVVVYPNAFQARRSRTDSGTGVVHEYDEHLRGEAWDRGPIVLSATDIELDLSDPGARGSVVIHEIAHKIDVLDSAIDGAPPLHRGMSRTRFIETLSAALSELKLMLQRGDEVLIDPYAATDPAEFFAVCSESFFLSPDALRTEFPAVFEQLERFYRPAYAGA
jgi:MtfA peptidase